MPIQPRRNMLHRVRPGHPTPCGVPVVSQYAARKPLQVSSLPATNPILSLYPSMAVRGRPAWEPPLSFWRDRRATT